MIYQAGVPRTGRHMNSASGRCQNDRRPYSWHVDSAHGFYRLFRFEWGAPRSSRRPADSRSTGVIDLMRRPANRRRWCAGWAKSCRSRAFSILESRVFAGTSSTLRAAVARHLSSTRPESSAPPAPFDGSVSTPGRHPGTRAIPLAETRIPTQTGRAGYANIRLQV